MLNSSSKHASSHLGWVVLHLYLWLPHTSAAGPSTTMLRAVRHTSQNCRQTNEGTDRGAGWREQGRYVRTRLVKLTQQTYILTSRAIGMYFFFSFLCSRPTKATLACPFRSQSFRVISSWEIICILHFLLLVQIVYVLSDSKLNQLQTSEAHRGDGHPIHYVEEGVFVFAAVDVT